MDKAFIKSDDIPAWSGPSVFHDGNVEYELKLGEHEKVSMMQAMLGQGGPTLEARSGVCLVIAVYVPRHEAGLLIHLWREEELSHEAADLIRKPFERFRQLADSPTIWMLTSSRLNATYPNQMDQAKAVIRQLAPTAQFREIVVTDKEDEISVDVELHTQKGELAVNDDFGTDVVIDCHI